ncbi:hypothetical protein [Pseudomonas sp.]|uniref:hypothetical protein n=1 Tax=Pseudomonas sp. TaxID=306 RepID=UPI00262CA554|nr:hypothetical protein [Pseudomonas sp.]
MFDRSCPHADSLGSVYTGTLCSACYRELEIRLPGLAAMCEQLRRDAAPGTVRAVSYGDRVQESAEQRLLIDDRRLALADDLFQAACVVVLVMADELSTDPPYALRGAVAPPRYSEGRLSPFAAQGIESWLVRNLRWIAQHELAFDVLDPLTEALTEARRATDPAPPRKPAIRGACSECLGRVAIVVLERGVFYSTCGGCGKRGPVHARVVEAVLSASDDGDAGGGGYGAHPDDVVELSGGGAAAVEAAGP